MPRERSRARPRKSGLLTVRHACASECFFRKKGSTVCETLLNMRELISWSFFRGQSFCCFHADLLFFTSSTLCADRRRRRIRRHRTTSESHRAKWLQTTPKVCVPYFAAQPRDPQPRDLEDTKKKLRHEPLDPIHEPCNSGAPCNRRTDWNCNVCSTESGHDQCPVSAWQQVTFPRVTFSAFSPASASLSKTWAPLDGAAVEKTALDFQIVDVSHDFHRPLASSLDWEPPATAIRRPAKPCPQTTPKAVVSIASSSGAQSKRKSSFGLLNATRAAKLYENRIDDQGHEGAICGGSQKSEAQA